MNSPHPDLAATKELLAGMAREAAELESALGKSVTDAMAGWLAPYYLVAANERLAGTDGARRWEILRSLVQDWTLLRRSDHAAARLQLDREALELQRANAKAQKEREFREWLNRPEIRARFFPGSTGGLTPDTVRKIEQELKLLLNEWRKTNVRPSRRPLIAGPSPAWRRGWLARVNATA